MAQVLFKCSLLIYTMRFLSQNQFILKRNTTFVTILTQFDKVTGLLREVGQRYELIAMR